MKNGISSTMRPMPRTIPNAYTPHPMHTVQSHSQSTDGQNENGLTFSSEIIEGTPAAAAEFEVLRAILQREEYIQRLHQLVRTISKKFKPEVADCLDLIRQATLEVIESIVRWRSIKQDNQAMFIWNGLNYVLKLSSDLDFLADYRAIQNWMGFSLIRNPFCIPFPLESSARMNKDESFLDPHHIDQSYSNTNGFTVGGSKQSKTAFSGKKRSSTSLEGQSFIFNEDMRRIRRAEEVILNAEARFGVLSRDPQGRLVPLLQALTRKAAVELKKDDRRPLSEPSTTNAMFAPHAATSDVGLADAAWTPFFEGEESSSEKTEKKVAATFAEDTTVQPRKRGEGKSGGTLAALNTKGSEGRAHRPIKSSASSCMDFNRFRNISNLNDRIAEIAKLREELQSMKKASTSSSEKNEILRSVLSNHISGVSRSASVLEPQKKNLADMTVNIDPKNIPADFFAPVEGKLEARKLEAETDANTSSLIGTTKPAGGSISPLSKKQLLVEESKARRQLRYLEKDEEIIYGLKLQERSYRKCDESRDIERKRRLLSEEEGQRQGPPSEDSPNVFDFYAIRLQCTIRGWLARCWVRWYRLVSHRATLLIQSVIRGWLGRTKVRRLKTRTQAATLIQKTFRGWNTRGTSAAVAKRHGLVKKAVCIQRVWRGVLGARRAESKRALDKAARAAMDAVDAKSLASSDVKELARRIIFAIEEPSTTSFPPDEVLHLLRITIGVIQSSRGPVGLTDYDFFNFRQYDEFVGSDLTWKTAAKMVNRSARFIRLIRTLAFGPGAKPPRLLAVSNDVSLLFAAQARNPSWSVHTFERMGLGSRICTQLFKWVTSILEIATRQQEFLSLIATSFPDWLPKLNDMEKLVRQDQFEIELNKKCLQLLQERGESRGDDHLYLEVLEKEIKVVKRALNEARALLKDRLGDIDRLKNDQSSREVVALQTLEKKVMDSNDELTELTVAFQEASSLANQGDRGAIEKVSELRHLLTNQRLKFTELQAQKKLLELQIESNRVKRKDPAHLTNDIAYRLGIAGEAKAAFVLAQVDCRAMLRSVGLKHPSDLPVHLLEIYEELSNKEESLRHEARQRFVEAEREKKAFDDLLARAITENELKEQKSKDIMMPTEEELEEDRLEDEKEALYEKLKHAQFIPDGVMYDVPTLRTSTIVAISRDVPECLRRKFVQRLTALMPGSFIPVECSQNLGFDVGSIQRAVDARKHVILSIDHGLTRTTRDSFMNIVELTLRAVIPSPTVVLIVGHEKNIRREENLLDCGVSTEMMASFRDKSIKACLEWQSWCAFKLAADHSLRYDAVRRAQETCVPSPQLAVVVEALFVLFFENDGSYRLPNHSMRSMIWPRSRKILLQLDTLASKMKDVRRGQFPMELLVCLKNYFAHPSWPSIDSTERSADLLLHVLASFVENIVQCELLTINGGGAPLQTFSKSAITGIRCVVTLADDVETLTLPYRSHRPSSVDVLPWNDHVADLVQSKVDFRVDGHSVDHGIALAVRSVLQEARVFKSTIKMGKDPYVISIYRDSLALFLEAYDASSSELFLTQVSVDKIPHLIMPNGSELLQSAKSGKCVEPPSSPAVMYDKLVRLLRFQKVNARTPYSRSILKSSRQLVCSRDFVFLQQLVLRIDGYQLLLKCYESCLGELKFLAYLPQLSVNVSAQLDVNQRGILLLHADRGDTDEYQLAVNEDARPLLNFAVDRLKIYPPLKMVQANYGDRKDLYAQRDVFRCGFLMTVRTRGPVGRIVCRRSLRLLNVLHVLEVRESSSTKFIDVRCYEPRQRKTCRLRINPFIRTVFLGPSGDHHSSWVPKLLVRIRKDWSGDHGLLFDNQVIRSVVHVENIMMIVAIFAKDAQSIDVRLSEPINNRHFQATLTLSDINILLRRTTNVNQCQSASQGGRVDASMSKLLQCMMYELNPLHSQSRLDDFADGVENSQAMLYFVSNKNCMRQFIKVLVSYMVRNKLQDLDSGYSIVECGLRLSFVKIDSQALSRQPLTFPYPKANTMIRKNLDIPASRCQPPHVDMEEELNALALFRAKQAQNAVTNHTAAAEAITSHMQTFADAETLNKAIEDGTKSASDHILNIIHAKVLNALRERSSPGYHQHLFEQEEIKLTSEDQKTVEVLHDSEDSAITGDTWTKRLEMGIKGNFRDGKVRWHGHISVSAYEDSCWIEDFGMGKRFKFVVYEPNSAQSFEGIIRSQKHLREVLGVKGQDLLDPRKEKEMMIFVSKYRLDVVVNKKTRDGADVEPGAPPYRIEFQSDRVFTNDKVTPINAGGDEDEAANNAKMLDIDNARGKKIMRLVKRVSGLLMQLTVFELPQAVALAALSSNPITGIEFTNDVDEADVAQPTPAGFAEERASLKVLKRWIPPAFRIVGYDPKSKRKVILGVEPQAVIEVSGGVFSPYLHPNSRRDLAKVVCDALVLNFPSGRPFELVIPWSGCNTVVSTAEVGRNEKVTSTRSGAEKVNKRSGRLFRAAMRISRYDLVVSLFQLNSETLGTQLIFNFYSPAVSEAVEVVVSEAQQVERLGRPILGFIEGSIRTAAVRRFCGFFAAEIIVDILEPTNKSLQVVLLPPHSNFVSNYKDIGVPTPGDDLRPVGTPAVFFPLDTCGRPLHRRGISLPNRDQGSDLSKKEFLVTIYSKSDLETPERGLVVKLYDRSTCETSVLHIGASELYRICDKAQEPDLIQDLINAQIEEQGFEVDDIESSLKEFTEQGKTEKKTAVVRNLLMDIVVKDLGFYIDAENKIIPYVLSAPRGILPV